MMCRCKLEPCVALSSLLSWSRAFAARLRREGAVSRYKLQDRGWLSTLNPISSRPLLGKGQRERVLLQHWVMHVAMVPWNCVWPQHWLGSPS